jgi:hypothetical protein
MPARGSGIGASISQSVFGGTGGATGRPVSPTTAAVYTAQGASKAGMGMSMFGNGQNGWGGPVAWLLLLVFAEVAAMALLRHGFRHHHGG